MKFDPVMKSSIVLVALTLLGASVANSAEGEIKLSKLPKAVRKTVKAKFPEAKIVKALKEEADHNVIYEVLLKDDGHAIDVSLTPDGKILEIEKEVPAAQLPKAVRRAIAAKYPNAEIEKAEIVSKGHDGPITYEISLKMEVVLTSEIKFVDTGASNKPDSNTRRRDKDDADDKPARKAKKHESEGEEDDDDDDDKPAGKSKKRESKDDDDDDDKPASKSKKHESEDEEDDDDDKPASKSKKRESKDDDDDDEEDDD